MHWCHSKLQLMEQPALIYTGLNIQLLSVLSELQCDIFRVIKVVGRWSSQALVPLQDE